jgi:hypothetical protein
MNTSDTLNLAADLIEERGWAKGSAAWYGIETGLCLEGAVGIAADLPACGIRPLSEDINICPAGQAVREYLELRPWREFNDGLWSWNDRTVRTKEQVIATLRATALMVAARESADELTEVSA